MNSFTSYSQPRVLVFRNQPQQQVIKFHNNSQQQQQASQFFISLSALEPEPQIIDQPTLPLIKTLIQSYQLIIQDLQKTKQEGLTFYFQNKINQIVQQSKVQQLIEQSEDKDLISILQKSIQPIKSLSVHQKEFENLQEEFRGTRQNTLVNYMNMQEKLEQEQYKAQQLIEEYDEQQQQFEKLKQQELDQQTNVLQNRLQKRSIQILQRFLIFIQDTKKLEVKDLPQQEQNDNL